MTKEGKKKKTLQKYQCTNGHVFRERSQDFDNSFIEHVVYVYLRCLSLNTTVDIVRKEYETDILSKELILRFIEAVVDKLPTIDDIDYLYYPKRLGYLVFDGLWFEFNGEEIVLLVAFDPETFDIVVALWDRNKTQKGYEDLITAAVNKIDAINIKGCYGDGDNGLIETLKHQLSTISF